MDTVLKILFRMKVPLYRNYALNKSRQKPRAPGNDEIPNLARAKFKNKKKKKPQEVTMVRALTPKSFSLKAKKLR